MDALLNAALPFAKQQLTNHGEFFPYGVTMSHDGQIEAIQVEVEHRDGIALKVFLPYRKKRFGGGLETGQMRAETGGRRIWSR
jgi:hypothetical protein